MDPLLGIPVGLALSTAAGLRVFIPLLLTSLAARFAYLTLVMSVGASLLWFWLLAHGDATRLSAFYFLVPVFGLLIGHLLLGEVVTGRDALGAIVIAVGISLAQKAVSA